MRWLLRLMAVGLLTAGVTVPALAQKTNPGKAFGEPTCGDHGTSVHFEANVKDAAAKALKEEKLVLAIHISGYFEDPEYT